MGSEMCIRDRQFAVVLDPNDDEDSFTIVSNNDSYGGSAVRAPEGNRVDLADGDIQDAVLIYNLKFEESGTYRVYYRARGADGSSNSFYTPTDFGADPSITETISSDGNYRWDRGGTFEVSGADIESTVEFLLSKREADAEIDSIVFHRSSSLTDSQLDQLAFV